LQNPFIIPVCTFFESGKSEEETGFVNNKLPEELSPVNLEDVEERTSPLSAATSAAAHVAPAAPGVHAAATAHAAAAAARAAATPSAPLTST
jgi:hypothetical protein